VRNVISVYDPSAVVAVIVATDLPSAGIRAHVLSDRDSTGAYITMATTLIQMLYAR
jgi:hypothetical protein